MSKWSKIRGPLATIAGAIAAYYTGGLSAAAMGASSSTAASAALTSAGIGAQLGSTVWQNDMAKQQARRQNEAANAAQIAAENRQLKYTEMQNVYNSPVNQMRRLYEAGLNPMLVYGGGNVTGNSSGQYASASAAPVTMANKQMARFDQMAAIANTAMDLQMKEVQLASMKQQQEAFPLNNAVQLEHARMNNKLLTVQTQLQTAQLVNELLFGNSQSGMLTNLYGNLTKGADFKSNLVSYYMKNGRFPTTEEYQSTYGRSTKKDLTKRSDYGKKVEDYTNSLVNNPFGFLF